MHRQKDHDDLRAPGTTGAHEPTVTTETDRSFPLAGGVTSRSHADPSQAGGEYGASTSEFGTTGPHDPDHGRRGLAEAAAAASGEPKFTGDPCATDDDPSSTANFIPGPHKTDTANAIDPKLHIPGEFPETPMETPGGRENDHAEFLPGDNRQTELDPRNTEQSASGDHHGLGKAAGIGAAGAGAAGLGAYAAGQHHQRESADIESATTNNPYNAKRVDPRLDGKHHYGRNAGLAGAGAAAAGGLYAANRRDNNTEPSNTGYQTSPTAAPGTAPASQQNMSQQTSQIPSESERKDHHYARDAGLVGAGAAGAGGLHHALHRDENPSSAQNYPTQATQAGMGQPPTSPQPNTAQQNARVPLHADEKDHNYGRNAGLAGAGAAAAGGLYYANKHDDKPDSGPASSTIGPHKSNVANVLDPRVKPDPALQGSHAKHQGTVGSSSLSGSSADNAAQGYGENRASHPSTSFDNQRYDPSAAGSHDPRNTSTDDHQDHHHGRNAALGAGAGALGYEAMKHHHDHHPSTSTTRSSASHDPEASPAGLEGTSNAGRSGAAPAGVQNYPPEHYPSRNYPPQNYPVNKRVVAAAAGPDPVPGESHIGERHVRDHRGTDAALAAGAGVATAGAMREGSEHHDSKTREPHVHYRNSPDTSTAQGAPTESSLGRGSQGSQIPGAGENTPYDQGRSEHHHGRNAGLAAGAGAAAAGIYGASTHHDRDAHHAPEFQESTYPPQAGQRNQTSQPGQSSHLPDASGYAPQDQQQSQHHYGRNAGLAAGAGVAGAGLYGASKHHGDATQQPGSEQYNTQQSGYQQASYPQQGAAAPYGTQNHDQANRDRDRYGRDAALATGAAGAGAYGASKYRGDTTQQPGSEQYNSQQPGYQQSSYPQQGEAALYGTQNQAYDEQANRDDEHHYGRDAALAAGAAGAGAYAYNKHQDKDAKKEQHALEKQQRAEQKAHEKEERAEQKAREKELAHERKLEQKEPEKQQAAAQPGTPEKKHGLFHRKSKSITKSPEHSPRTSLEAAECTGRTSLDGGRNKLHKNPPPGHPAWEVLNNKQQGPQHIGADGNPDKLSQDE